MKPLETSPAGDRPADSVSEPAHAGGAAELVASLSGLDANRDRALTNRTRRAVQDAAADLREGRHLGRRSGAIALLTMAGLLMLLSPAIWNSVDDVLGGEFLLDLPGMVAALAFTLFAAVAAVLFLVSGQGKRDLRQSRR
jgi:hypothetical protein